MSEKVKKLNHKNNITVSTVSLFDFYFDFLNTNYYHYIRIAKMKKESSYSFAE